MTAIIEPPAINNPYCRHGDVHSFCPYSPEQEAFASSPAFEVFFGGAAGPGKTILLLNEGLRQIDVYGYRAILFRRSYDELDQVVDMSHQSFPEHGGVFKQNEMRWEFKFRPRSAHHGIGRGRRASAEYLFRYCERDKDKFRYQGRSFAYIAWDELTQYATPAVYMYLFLRCRPLWQGQNVRCYIRAASNPGGPGHSWVKARFINERIPRQLYRETVEDPVTGKRLHYLRQFIPATLDSNDILMADGHYEISLLAYPDPEIRRAMRHGHWDIAAGVMFSELRERLHCEPPRPPLSWTEKEIALDWGYGDFAFAVWLETSSGAEGMPHSWAYREYVVNEMPPPLVAQMICQMTPETEPIRRITIDSAAWATPQDGGPSPAEQMLPKFRERGWAVIPVTKGAGSRRRGWALLHTYFYPNRRGGPLLKVMKDACPVLWHQLTSLARGVEPHDVEDLEPHQVDDGADALRYWAQGRPAVAEPTPDEILAADPDLDKLIDPKSYEYAQIERLRQEQREALERRAGFPAVQDRPRPKPRVQPRRGKQPW